MARILGHDIASTEDLENTKAYFDEQLKKAEDAIADQELKITKVSKPSKIRIVIDICLVVVIIAIIFLK